PNETEGLRLEQLLPPVETPYAADADPDVLRLLAEGRKKESCFDLRHSPLAAHLYAHLGDAASDRALDAEDGWPLIEALPKERVVELAEGCARVAPTRAAALQAIVDRLSAT